MKVLYISNMASESVFHSVFGKNGKRYPSQAGQKYHNLTLSGLRKNGVDVTNFSVLPLSASTYAGKWFSGKKHSTKEDLYLSMPTVSGLRHIWIFLSVFIKTLFFGWKKERIVVCDVLNFTVSLAVLLATRLSPAKSVGIVTDVPTKRAKKADSLKMKLYTRLSFSVLKSFDSFVFLTSAMNELINEKGRPFVVAEGLVDIEESAEESKTEKYPQKVCLYAGSLKKIYGIGMLIDGFLKAGVENSALHIYGAGDFEEEIKKICEREESIKFFGIVPNSRVVEEEKKVSLLINPRPTDEEYTRYSFPSKNMEYMVSGTPLLTTCLPGMPQDHKEHIFLIEEESAEGIATALREIFSHTGEELGEKGKRAREFILNEKNNLVQAIKLVEMMKKL